MRATQTIIILTTLIIITGAIIVTISEDADAAVCIGTWNEDNNHNSTFNNAYGRVDWSNTFTIDSVNDGERIYVLDGSYFDIVSVYDVTFTIVSSNTLGLSLYAPNSIDGPLTGIGTVELTASSGSTTKTFYVQSVTDNTVYVESVSISMWPENPTVGETVTFTANFTPSNPTNRVVSWVNRGISIWGIFEETGRTDNTLTGYFTEAVSSRILAYAQEDWGYYFRVESPDYYFEIAQLVTDIEWSGETVYDVGDEIYITATGLPDDVDDPRIRFTVLSGEDCLTDAGFGVVGGPFTATTVAAGTVRLQGTAVDDGGYSETITITINAPDPVNIGIEGPTSIDPGDEFRLVADVTGGNPAHSSHGLVSWSVVSGSEYVTLDSMQINNQINNTIFGTGKAPGTAVFRATSKEDPSVYKDWTLTINPVDPITISVEGPTEIDVGDEFRLVANVTGGNPAHSSHGLVSWSVVSGSEYVTLDSMQINNYSGRVPPPGR